MLSERQAWKVAAVVFTRPRGLCATLESLWLDGVISKETLKRMYARIERYKKREKVSRAYCWPLLPAEHDDPRVNFAEAQARNGKKGRKRK